MQRSQFLLAILVLLTAMNASADWKDLLKKLGGDSESAAAATQALGLSQQEMVAGLKEALDMATEIAVTELGKEGGYLNNASAHIPIPEKLAWIEKSLRKIGQEDLADEFVVTMNRAAEEAVPVALDQFRSAIDAMTLEDAKTILDGPDDAATQYFRNQSEASLREQFLPVVEKTTASAGVTSAYKDMTKYTGKLGGLVDTESIDVDQYVTEQALDGLFRMVAEEEARIREDPLARTTDLLKKVFGS